MTSTAPTRTTASPNPLVAARDRILAAWFRAVAPRPSGLPNLLVLLGFPIVVVVAVGVLVALGISGSSSGVYWSMFGTGHDPDLLAGTPRAIRSDEWLVQSSWILSQVREGFPAFNHSFPGGMDATVQNDLPSWDWSTIFRPHVAGFLFLPLDQGMAVRWWLPVLATLIAVYAFVVSLLPRRPATAAFLAIGICLSPMIQWWFLPTTIWPVAWAFAGLTAVVWALRSTKRWPAIVAAVGTGYLTVTMVMSIYVPYMVPAALVLILVAVGLVVGAMRTPGVRVRRVLLRLIPLASAAVGAVAVAGIWALTRIDTIRAVVDTVYPGQRLQATGQVDIAGLIPVLSGPFQRALQWGGIGGIGVNQSESAAPLLVAVFIMPALLWCVVRAARARRVDWPVVAVLAGLVIVFAFLLVPHWDLLAHLTLLDRTTDARMRLAFDLLGVVAVVLVVANLDERTWHVAAVTDADAVPGAREPGRMVGRGRLPWLVSVLGPVVTLGITGWVYLHLRAEHAQALGASGSWKYVTVLLAVGVLLVARRWVATGALAILAAAVIVGLTVNPLYKGVFDLGTQTQAGRAVSAIVRAHPDARWVGIGGYVTTSMLLETGADSFNGVQTYPPKKMWHEIDPSGEYEHDWNRLANVSWVDGDGAPVVSVPVRDQIQVTFDGCSTFAQRNVEYVLSDAPVHDQCITQERKITQGTETLYVYRVD